ncbi:MAG: nicotinate-nucleotide adenylyltransferase [Parachlamydia sp.]|nr:nicotinate-nucleotide adenylyltransferase [Parachlamydia sp.]
MESKKIGLLGGSFDPIHFGHINLAIELKEKAHLDEVWFIPARLNPQKERQHASHQERIEMVRLAIKDIPYFKCLDIEAKRPPPSYTIDTLRFLIKEHPYYLYYLLLGDDCSSQFEKWHESEKITELVTLLVGSRPGTPFLGSSQAMVEFKTRQIDISSTELRSRLLKKLYCGHLIPAKSLSYIFENDIYRS